MAATRERPVIARAAMPSRRAREGGFTLVEVLATGAVLSVLVLCLVRAWAVFDTMSLDLQVRQKAVFILNGEMERLSALYTVGGFGGAGPGQLQSVSGTLYPAIAGISGSANRLVYGSATSSASGFTVGTYSTFANPGTAESAVLLYGTGSSTQNFIWLDRGRNIMGRLSWVACPVSGVTLIGSSTASVCWGAGSATASSNCYAYTGLGGGGSGLNSVGAPCYLLTLVLDYPYRWLSGAPVAESQMAGAHLSSSSLTLSTIVGRWS